MLVLSRKIGEKIQIGDSITVVVTRISGNRVTLGVAAPKNMRIVRSELKPLSGQEEVSLITEAIVPRRLGTVTVEVSPGSISLMAPRRAR